MLGGVGDLLGAFAGGRSGTAGLKRMARRRSEVEKTEARLGDAEATIAARAQDIAEIEADLAADVEEVTAKWDAVAAAIEPLEIGLERTDVRVLDLRLAWLPVDG